MASSATSGSVPKAVEDFVESFGRAISEASAPNLARLMEVEFPKLSDTYYPKGGWPQEEPLRIFDTTLQDSKPIVVGLYREICFRHWHAVRVGDREAAWRNYMTIFEFFLASSEDERMQTGDRKGFLKLPAPWLWELIDEFVYQYYDAQQLKSKGLADFSNALWDTEKALRILRRLDESGAFANHAAEGQKEEAALFPKICRLRIHVMWGEFQDGLESVGSLPAFDAEGPMVVPPVLHGKAFGCRAAFYHNLSFVYLMLRRYCDSLRAGTLFLLSARGKITGGTQQQHKAISKLMDKISVIVVMASALLHGAPAIERPLHANLELQEFVARLQHDDFSVYEEMFKNCAPKFASLPATGDGPPDTAEPAKRLLEQLLHDVRQRQAIFALRSTARLYKNVPLAKLAMLLNFKEASEAQTRAQLEELASSDQQLVWMKGSLASGEVERRNGDISLSVDGSMVKVETAETAEPIVALVVEQMKAVQELLSEAARLDVPKPKAPPK